LACDKARKGEDVHPDGCHADTEGDALDILDQGVAHGVGHAGQLNMPAEYFNNADLHDGVLAESAGGPAPRTPRDI
jgi:hypothetical protein